MSEPKPTTEAERAPCKDCDDRGQVQDESDDKWIFCTCPVGDKMRRVRRDEAQAMRAQRRNSHVLRQVNTPWRKAILEVLDRALEDDLVVCVYTRGYAFVSQMVMELSPSVGIVRLAIASWSPDGVSEAGDEITTLPLSAIEAVTCKSGKR